MNPKKIFDISALDSQKLMYCDNMHKMNVLLSGIRSLDDFMGGGLPYGCLVEFGVPVTHGGRLFLLPFLAQATRTKQLILWINGHDDLNVCPLTLYANGIDPEFILFADSTKPFEDMRCAFLSPLFKIIVIDVSSRAITQGESAFLSQRARLQGQIVILLRDTNLTAEKGNAFAKIRMNIGWSLNQNGFLMRFLRGGAGQQERLMGLQELEPVLESMTETVPGQEHVYLS